MARVGYLRLFVFFAAASMVAVAADSLGGAAIAAPPASPPPPSTLTEPATTWDLPACTPVATTKQTQANGAIVTRYVVNGVAFSQTTPPAGFDPLTASDADLAANGFPARPTDPNELAIWQAVARSSVAPPAPCVLAGVSAGSTGGFSVTSTATWAGIVDRTQEPSQYTYAGGEFYQTGFNNACTNGHSASWVGLGGFNQPDLAQTGTLDNQNGQARDFHEVLYHGSDTGAISNGLLIRPGDQVFASVLKSSGANVINYSVLNITLGTSTGWMSTGDFDGNTTGSSADFVDEAPKVGGVNSPLRQWYNANILWTEVLYELNYGPSYAAGSTFHYDVNMARSDTLAGPTYEMVNNNEFYDFWYHCT